MCVSYYIPSPPPSLKPLWPLTCRTPHTHDSFKCPEPHTHSVIHTTSVTLPPSQPYSQGIRLFTQKAIHVTTEQVPHISLKVVHNERHKAGLGAALYLPLLRFLNRLAVFGLSFIEGCYSSIYAFRSNQSPKKWYQCSRQSSWQNKHNYVCL